MAYREMMIEEPMRTCKPRQNESFRSLVENPELRILRDEFMANQAAGLL